MPDRRGGGDIIRFRPQIKAETPWRRYKAAPATLSSLLVLTTMRVGTCLFCREKVIMAISLNCACGQALQVKDEFGGQQIKCPKCAKVLSVPDDTAILRTDALDPPAPPAPTRSRQRDDGDDEDEQSARPGPAKTSGKATASLVLGIASFFCLLLTGIPAIILGIMSLRAIGRSQGRLQGSTLALVGIVLGTITTALSLVGVPLILIGLLLPAVQKVREAAGRIESSNNLRQIGIAMHDYHTANQCFPAAAITNANGQPLLSWRVALLPYLGDPAANQLYKRFKLDEPWDSVNNLPLLAEMPRAYRLPAAPGGTSDVTFFRVFTGPQTVFPSTKGLRFADITDGTSNTVLVVEAADGVPWTKPDELPYASNRPLPRLGGHFRSGFLVLFADGSVRQVGQGTGEPTLRKIITATGNKPIDSNRELP